MFPRLIIFFLAAFMVLFAFFENNLDPAVLGGQIIGVGLWICYFLQSDRVKNTFVN
jgi:hypothetical protein